MKIRKNKNLFQAIKIGVVKNNKNINLIRKVTLKQYLDRYNGNRDWELVKAIKNSIKTTVNNRNSVEWVIYKNSTNDSLKELKNIALLSRQDPQSFDDIVAIDFSKYLKIIQDYPEFKVKLYKCLTE